MFTSHKIQISSLFVLLAALTDIRATPSCSGLFVDVYISLGRTTFHETLASKGQKGRDGTVFVDEKKWGYGGGAGGGYGREFGGRFYVGVVGKFLLSTVEIKEDDSHKEFTGINCSIDGVNNAVYEGFYTLCAKPTFTLGGQIQIGFKILPNALIYIALGYESTSFEITQQINAYTADAAQAFFVANGAFKPFKDVSTSNHNVVSSMTANKTDAAKIWIPALAPSLGVKFFLTPMLYTGVDLALSKGKTKLLPEKFYNNTNTLRRGKEDDPSSTTFEGPNIRAQGATLHISSKTGFRACLIIGAKF